jgi:hypothetical protein
MVGVVTCFAVLSAGYQGGRQVNAKCRLCTNKRWIQPVECVGEHGSGVGLAEAGECVSAPSGEVHGVEGDVGSFVARVIR